MPTSGQRSTRRAAALEQAREHVELARFGNGDDLAGEHAACFVGRRAHRGRGIVSECCRRHLRIGGGALRGDGFQARELDDDTGLDAIEVEIGVVLAQQPHRHVVGARCQDPQRLAGLDRRGCRCLRSDRRRRSRSGSADDRRGGVARTSARRRGRTSSVRLWPSDHGFAERQRVHVAQALRRNLEPIGVVAERLERLHGDLVVGGDGVVAGIGREHVLLARERVARRPPRRPRRPRRAGRPRRWAARQVPVRPSSRRRLRALRRRRRAIRAGATGDDGRRHGGVTAATATTAPGVRSE